MVPSVAYTARPSLSRPSSSSSRLPVSTASRLLSSSLYSSLGSRPPVSLPTLFKPYRLYRYPVQPRQQQRFFLPRRLGSSRHLLFFSRRQTWTSLFFSFSPRSSSGRPTLFSSCILFLSLARLVQCQSHRLSSYPSPAPVLGGRVSPVISLVDLPCLSFPLLFSLVHYV